MSVNKNNIARYLVNNKEIFNKYEKSGIYELNWDDRDANYLGQTGRSLQQRLKEHRHSILNKQKLTGFVEHCIDDNHLFNNERVKLLYSAQKEKHMDYLEIFSIKKPKII